MQEGRKLWTKDELIHSSIGRINKKHNEDYHAKYFASIAGTKIILPKKYYPKKEFLQFHLDEIFRG